MDREQLFFKIREILVDQFEVEESIISLDANLYEELEIDSIDAVDLMVQIKELTGKKIRDLLHGLSVYCLFWNQVPATKFFRLGFDSAPGAEVWRAGSPRASDIVPRADNFLWICGCNDGIEKHSDVVALPGLG